MKRFVLCLALLGAGLVSVAGASARATSVPCRDRIYADWYADGTIASTYPLACYRDALKHARGRADIAVYSGLIDDIKLALAAAIKRSQGQDVPKEIGGTTPISVTTTPISVTTTPTSSTPTTPSNPATTPTHTTTRPPTSTDTIPDTPDPGPQTTSQTTTAVSPVSAPSTGGGSGLPVPLLVLGGAAIVLIGSGAIGYGVRRYRRGPA